MKIAEILLEMPVSKAFVIGVLLAGVYWLIGYDSGVKWVTTIKRGQQDISKLRKEQSDLKSSISRAKNFKENLRLKDEQFKRFTNYIPSRLSVADMMRAISAEAKAAGSNIISIKDASKSRRTESSFYETVAIQVELQGSFPQHLLFLSFLTRLEIIVTVDSVGFSAPRRKDQVDAESIRLTATLIGYKYTVEDEAKPTRGG